MLTLLMAGLGLLVGFFRSRRRGGKIGDNIQWALVHAVGFALLTLIIGTVYLNVTA